MKFSRLFVPTLREAPSDADIISAKLMLRSGMIRKVASGLYEWLPLGLKVLKKVENIIREEMNAAGGQEVWLPILQPKELWEETGRWSLYGKELFRLKDRKNTEFGLGPTAEEVITDLVRREVRSYRQLPLMLYQFGEKFRDEIRPRFGIMRAREFLMKDAYSFHVDEKDAERYYEEAFKAYKRVCERCGFEFRAVEATTGNIGGSFSHEFMVLAETGEEEIVSCECGYGANTEKASCAYHHVPADKAAQQPVKEVHTPELHTVGEVGKFLNLAPETFIKTLIYMADGKPVIALVRGNDEVNEAKLQQILNCGTLFLADAATIEKVSGAPQGFAGPVGLADASVKIVADFTVQGVVNGVTGANKKDHHLLNVNYERDYNAEIVADIRKVKPGEVCVHCSKPLTFSRGIEIGHTFKLGTKYSKAMKATYLDAEGKEQLMVMGCYGIGVSRIVAATIEQSHDENGIIWPLALAPYQVVIIAVNWQDENTRKVCEDIYARLKTAGIEVLLDDREDRAGIKFKDADLIGIPFRITVGEKGLKENIVELKHRRAKQGDFQKVPVTDIVETIKKLILG